MTGLELIAEERKRQIEQEHWSAEHDKTHSNGELAWAAACYAAPSPIFRWDFEDAWPWEPEWDKRKKHDRLRQLVIAGALIAAEIDRIQG